MSQTVHNSSFTVGGDNHHRGNTRTTNNQTNMPDKMSQAVHNSSITYGNNNSICGNTHFTSNNNSNCGNTHFTNNETNMPANMSQAGPSPQPLNSLRGYLGTRTRNDHRVDNRVDNSVHNRAGAGTTSHYNDYRFVGNGPKLFDAGISIPDMGRQFLGLSSLASQERHQAVRDARVTGVGDWLLRNQSFSTWHASEDRTAKPVLFCYGHPGAGKTYISSLVIDALSNGVDGDGVAVAYVYCDFNTRNVQSASTVLESVLRQVVGALAEIPGEVRKAFERAEGQIDGRELRLPEMLDMLIKSLLSFKRGFICVDALDEFPENHRAQLWNSLQRIVRECPNARLFLTGRPQVSTEVEDYLPKETIPVTIEPTPNDIATYIAERLVEDLAISAMNSELRLDISRVIPKMATGIFLLVRIGMDAILAERTIQRRKQALDRIANGFGLQDAYNPTLDRIRQQDRDKSRLGMVALMWVSHCERPLRSQELCHALGTQLGAEDFNIDNVPSMRTVLGCTLGLVTVDENTSMVRLLHHTLQKYLGTSSFVFPTQPMMAEICLTYLNSPSVREQQPGADKALAASPFLEYATRFWGTHAAREVTEQMKSRALRLLDGYENHVSAAIFWRERIRESCSEGDVRGISGLHCIAFWGIPDIAIAMLETKKWDVNGRDSRSDTPLMWAVRYGNDRMVELLLGQADIRPDMVIRGGRTLFSFAAGSGNEGAVKLLLERGDVNPDSRDDGGRTPLSFAASGGHGGVVKLLLRRGGVDPNSLDGNDLTPLSYGAITGASGVVKLLLGSPGVNPNSPDSSGRTPLSFAALRGHEGVVELLLQRKDVNPDSWDYNGQTPLSLAASGGYEGVVGLLLQRKDVNSDSLDRSGRTSLSFAASGGYEGVVKLLLERKGVNPDSSDNHGQTPLSFAASGGHEGVVKLLLERKEVNPDSSDSHGQTPLSFAASGGHEGVVKLLLGRGDVDPNSLDGNNLTPLSYAATSGAPGAVKLLLESNRVNPNSPDSSGRTSLSFAASRGHEGVVKVLLGRGDASPDSSDANGLTPLSYAAITGASGVVKLLLECRDVNPDSPDSRGRTPLSFAAFRGHECVVKVLLRREDVDPNSPDHNGQTPLSYATTMRREGVVKLLLEARNTNSESLGNPDQSYLYLAPRTLISTLSASLVFPFFLLTFFLFVFLFFYFSRS